MGCDVLLPADLETTRLRRRPASLASIPAPDKHEEKRKPGVFSRWASPSLRIETLLPSSKTTSVEFLPHFPPVLLALRQTPRHGTPAGLRRRAPDRSEPTRSLAEHRFTPSCKIP